MSELLQLPVLLPGPRRLTESGSRRRAAGFACATLCCSSSGFPAGFSPLPQSLPHAEGCRPGIRALWFLYCPTEEVVMGLAPPSSVEKPATATQLTKQGSRVWFGFYLPPTPKNTGPTVPTIHRVAFGKEERFFSQEDQAAAAGPDKCFIGRGKMFKEELWPRKGERMKASRELWAFGLTPPPLTQHLTCPFCLQEM